MKRKVIVIGAYSLIGLIAAIVVGATLIADNGKSGLGAIILGFGAIFYAASSYFSMQDTQEELEKQTKILEKIAHEFEIERLRKELTFFQKLKSLLSRKR